MWCSLVAENVEAELLHTYNKIEPYDTLILCVRLAVLTAVTLTVPIVLFPVSKHTPSPEHTRVICAHNPSDSLAVLYFFLSAGARYVFPAPLI